MTYAEKKLIIKNAWAKYLVGDHHDKSLNDEYTAALQMLTIKQNERFEKEEIEEEWRNKADRVLALLAEWTPPLSLSNCVEQYACLKESINEVLTGEPHKDFGISDYQQKMAAAIEKWSPVVKAYKTKKGES